MTMVKYNNRRLPVFGSLFDDIFTRSFADEYESATSISRPAVNINETANSFQVEVAAPGFDKKDFKVEVDNKQLIISGNMAVDKTDKVHYTKQEFVHASFKRRFTLPDTVKESKITGEYVNGILKLTLPKMEEAVVQPAREVKIS